MRHHPDDDARRAEHVEKTLGAVAQLNDAMTQLTVGLKTLDAVRLQGAEAKPISLANAGGTPTIGGTPGLISYMSGRWAGVSLRETSGNAAVVRVHNGVDAAGGLIGVFVIPANGAVNQWFERSGSVSPEACS